MNCRVVFTDRSFEQVARAQEWWESNRPSARDLFQDELAQALELLRYSPRMGRPFPRPEAPDLRVVVLRRTRFLLYYVHDSDGDEVLVVAVWSGVRGAMPPVGPD